MVQDLRIDELQRALEAAETETDRLQAEAKNTTKSVHEQAGTNDALRRELTHLQQELEAYKVGFTNIGGCNMPIMMASMVLLAAQPLTCGVVAILLCPATV